MLNITANVCGFTIVWNLKNKNHYINTKQWYMETHKIKVLETTPSDLKGTVLTIEEFRNNYPTIVNKDNSDAFLINYLTEGYKSDKSSSDYSKWFEVTEIKTNDFRVGDWVWHEGLKQAFCITHSGHNGMYEDWKPNYCSFEVANYCVEMYKRKATQEEIDYYDLVSFCDKRVLISQYKCYYFNSVWLDLIGVHKNISNYLLNCGDFQYFSTVRSGSVEIKDSWACQLNGLKIGCKVVSHEEILEIAKQLKLIP